MKIDQLAGARVGLLGVGIDVMALVPHLSRYGVTDAVAYVDDVGDVASSIRQQLLSAEIELRPVEDLSASIEVWVRSPGFPRYRPDVVAARGSHPAPMTTPVDLWLHTFGAGHHVTLVTGTKGKSTVTTAIGALVDDAVVCGNIGVPVWSLTTDVADGRQPVVCEMSSYQAADIHISADLAVVTSLGADHVSWHGSLEQYHADKLGPVRAAKQVVGNGSDPLVLALLEEVGGTAVQASQVQDPELRAYLSDLPGHSATNAALAVRAAEMITGTPPSNPSAAQRLRALQPLVGRLRVLGSAAGKRWVDDALASNPMACAAALDAFPDETVWLVVGGLDRDVTLEPIEATLQKRAPNSVHLVTVPDNGPQIAEALRNHTAVASTHACENVAAAVKHIAAQPGTGIGLFSPAAPTPPQHGNWAERAAALERAVNLLPN